MNDEFTIYVNKGVILDLLRRERWKLRQKINVVEKDCSFLGMDMMQRGKLTGKILGLSIAIDIIKDLTRQEVEFTMSSSKLN
jgi:hypothetical protein